MKAASLSNFPILSINICNKGTHTPYYQASTIVNVNGNKIGALDGFYELTLAELFRKLSRRAIEHAPFRVAYKIEIVRRDSDDRLP